MSVLRTGCSGFWYCKADPTLLAKLICSCSPVVRLVNKSRQNLCIPGKVLEFS